MPPFIEQAYAAGSNSHASSEMTAAAGVFMIVMLAWYIIWIVQAFFGYGTAYRKTKANGDNGVSLFGWIIVYSSLAALVPGLGIYLWKKSKEEDAPVQQAMPYYGQPQMGQPAQYYGQTAAGQQPTQYYNQPTTAQPQATQYYGQTQAVQQPVQTQAVQQPVQAQAAQQPVQPVQSQDSNQAQN